MILKTQTALTGWASTRSAWSSLRDTDSVFI